MINHSASDSLIPGATLGFIDAGAAAEAFGAGAGEVCVLAVELHSPKDPSTAGANDVRQEEPTLVEVSRLIESPVLSSITRVEAPNNRITTSTGRHMFRALIWLSCGATMRNAQMTNKQTKKP